MKRTVLGRGLEALIPEKGRTEASKEEIIYLPLEEVHSNPFQPRSAFTPEKIEELTNSIREKGIIQPLLVRKKGDSYELIAGERRWRAAQLAGIKEIPVIVKEISDSEALELSLIENIQREDLNPLEEAEAYKNLIEKFNYTQEELAKRLGKSRTLIANTLRLLRLPEAIKQSLKNQFITPGHARAILSLEGHARQLEVHQFILKKGLSVRDTERLIQRIKEKGKVSLKRSQEKEKESIFYSEVENELKRWLATQVKIIKRGRGGRIVIEFYSLEEFDRILEKIKGGR